MTIPELNRQRKEKEDRGKTISFIVYVFGFWFLVVVVAFTIGGFYATH